MRTWWIMVFIAEEYNLLAIPVEWYEYFVPNNDYKAAFLVAWRAWNIGGNPDVPGNPVWFEPLDPDAAWFVDRSSYEEVNLPESLNTYGRASSGCSVNGLRLNTLVYLNRAAINDRKGWSVDKGPPNMEFQVALHEAGHDLGLGHSAWHPSAMEQFYNPTQAFIPKTDDLCGVNDVYASAYSNGMNEELCATLGPE